jgi:nucleoside-diphosphate-sugar epimerase
LRVLLTGRTGFIGSALVPRLLEHEVHFLDRYIAGRLYPVESDQFTHVMDLTDYVSVNRLIEKIRPEIVVHLAALSPVSYSYDHPEEAMKINALATINLAEACLKVPGFQHFVAAGTTEEYGMTLDRPANEESRCSPNSPYSVSKHAATKYLQYLHMAKGFPVTIMRATNTYGRTRDCHFFVEKTIKQMLNGADVFLGDPAPVRDFMYVDDHIDAYMKAIENRDQSVGKVFNIATGEYANVKQYAERIARVLGYEGKVSWNSIAERPLDIQDHRIDASKAKKVLGWEAKVRFEVGVAKTARLLEATIP